jgi:L,D-transpeptidase catalytic domain/Putative peptidoglycan binding domain
MRVAAAWILALLVAPSAHAASPFSLQLTAPAAAEYRQTITLRGRITPPLVDAPVTLLRDGQPFAEVRTRSDGTFSHRFRVEGPAVYQARAGEIESEQVQPNVRPRLRARLVGRGAVGSPLRLVVTVQPATNIHVVVRRGRRVILNRTYFGSRTIRLGTRRPGRLRVSVSAETPAGWQPASQALDVAIVVPRLALGSRGWSVRALEERLRELRYALQRVDGLYALDTYQAVLTFQKVQGLPWTGRVDARVWNRLRHARPPRARYRGTHLEISKGRQYLLAVRRGQVTAAVHVSTGATGNTPLGRWRVYRKVPGWDWVLWYPMYFLRGFAIHGYPSVPSYPASHGCVRVPMWIAPRLYATNVWGSTVYVY